MKSVVFFKMVLVSALMFMAGHLSAEEAEGKLRLPMRIIDRPSTMPTGIFNADFNAKLIHLKTVGLDVRTQFGIINNVEGRLSYDGLKFNDTRNGKTEGVVAERIVTLGGKWSYYSFSNANLSASASLPLHVLDGEIVRNVVLGLPVTFFNDTFAGQIFGDVFTLTMRPNVEMALDFPFWVGAQVWGNLWADVSSSFGNLKMENKNNQAKWVSKGFWQQLPLTVSATYAFHPQFDLGANIGFDDVFKVKETFVFGLTFSTRCGRLFG